MNLNIAVKKVYEDMPPVFDGITFIEQVRELVDRNKMYGETVLRKIRELRKRGEVDYFCRERKLSQYEKKEV